MGFELVPLGRFTSNGKKGSWLNQLKYIKDKQRNIYEYPYMKNNSMKIIKHIHVLITKCLNFSMKLYIHILLTIDQSFKNNIQTKYYLKPYFKYQMNEGYFFW